MNNHYACGLALLAVCCAPLRAANDTPAEQLLLKDYRPRPVYNVPKNRLVYGTDMGRARAMYLTTFRVLETEDEHFYDWDLFTYHWPLHGLGLPDPVLKKVYSKNALKILGQLKRKVD